MATATDKALRTDGVLSALGGVDSGRLPNLLDQDQIAWGINVTLRGGYLMDRPGFLKRTLTYEDTEASDWFTKYRLQGASTYLRFDGMRDLAVMVEGRLFFIDVATWSVTEATPTFLQNIKDNQFIVPAVGATATLTVRDTNRVQIGYPVWIGPGKYVVTDRLSSTQVTVRNVSGTPAATFDPEREVYFCDPNTPQLLRVWFCQAEEYLIVQNGSNLPIIWDGSTSRRSDPSIFEVPVGKSMVYANKRLWVNVNDRDIAVGDIYAGPTEVYEFTEQTYLAEGGMFHTEEDIGGLFVATNADTSTGQGPVLVFTRTKIYSISVSGDRAKWKDSTTPLQTIVMTSNGSESAYSLTTINSDVFYRAPDGIRSYVQARREYSQWGHVPISVEVDRALQYDDENLLRYASSMIFNNWLITTYGPVQTQRGLYHQGMVVLDFTTVARMSKRTAPAWEGIWKGIYPIILVSGDFDHVERGFVWALSVSGLNELWEIREDEHTDNSTQRIHCSVETRSLFATDLKLKKIEQLEIFVDELRDKVDVQAQYRPDQIPCWFNWNNGNLCATVQDCEQTLTGDQCKALQGIFLPGYRTRVGFGTPPDGVCEEQDFKASRVGYEFQVRLAWTGHMRIRKMIVRAREQEEQPFATCITNADYEPPLV